MQQIDVSPSVVGRVTCGSLRLNDAGTMVTLPKFKQAKFQKHQKALFDCADAPNTWPPATSRSPSAPMPACGNLPTTGGSSR